MCHAGHLKRVRDSLVSKENKNDVHMLPWFECVPQRFYAGNLILKFIR